jgi:fumarylacetoacetate (FAA) hydrolase
VDVLPGDVIGSGTVGTGCFLELNGTGLRLNPETYTPVWLQAGDTIALEISGLGRLENTIVAEEDNFSILARKKNLPAIKK